MSNDTCNGKCTLIQTLIEKGNPVIYTKKVTSMNDHCADSNGMKFLKNSICFLKHSNTPRSATLSQQFAFVQIEFMSRHYSTDQYAQLVQMDLLHSRKRFLRENYQRNSPNLRNPAAVSAGPPSLPSHSVVFSLLLMTNIAQQ